MSSNQNRLRLKAVSISPEESRAILEYQDGITVLWDMVQRSAFEALGKFFRWARQPAPKPRWKIVGQGS